MKKTIVILLTLILSVNVFKIKANEGMWLPFLLGGETYKNMQDCGLRLTPDQIYSVNNSSIKDAIVALGGGFCTGEIISAEGLMLTNHHCGYEEIQRNSTTEHDYLTDGFWAMSRDQEIPADFSVWFLREMKDVTDIVLDGITDEMSEQERAQKIEDAIAELKADASEGKEKSQFQVQVKSFYYGNNYYMFTYDIFNDVRLVGAPPSSIGKYGGDTDNWMWPRHTGDFCMFRVYANKDNEPADYSEDNVPYRPKHFLPVSIAGVEEGDYAMILGYPGSTDRFLTSMGVKQAVEIEQPARVKIRRMKLDIMEEGMNKDQKVRIQYASKHARVSNYWKYFIGQSEQLVNNNVYDKKKDIEGKYLSWAAENKTRKEKYADAIQMVEATKIATEKYIIPNVYFEEAVYQGPELFGFMFNNFGFRSSMAAALTSGDENEIKKAKEEIISQLADFYKDYNAEIDQNLLAAMLEVYYNDVPEEFHPQALIDVAKKYKNDFGKFAAKYFAKSPFTSEDNVKEWLNSKFSKDALEKDLVYQLSSDFIANYIEKVIRPAYAVQEGEEKGMRLFVDGLNQMGMNKASDANSTMRITYGNVLPYDAKDGVTFKHFTTLKGVMEKEVITEDKNHEFYVPERLKELHKNRDYGQYADKDGNLPVGFLSNNDITGGNSGSPVINAYGELIGTAFDGNWEAMSGDIYFEPNIQRTISVDIRYTLFVIDKYANAGHLIDEMKLVKTRKQANVDSEKEKEDTDETIETIEKK